ncbi:MAG: hypothetical protein H7Y09_00500 [Chitinophagaceae bacterium]|nr:hypothetical protein [Anaerolineae bacterium]
MVFKLGFSFRRFSFVLSPAEKIQSLLILVWLFLMIVLPIFYWRFGDQVIRTFVSLVLFAQFFATISVVFFAVDLYSFFIMFLLAAAVAWFFEFF